MAKRSGGPGTYTQQGVRCTMNAPFGKAASAKAGSGPGIDGRNKAPFDKPQSMGNGGLPTRFFDGMPAKAATTVPAGQVSPPIGKTQAVGTRRFRK